MTIKFLRPGPCRNCRKPIYGTRDGNGGWIFKHLPHIEPNPCDFPERNDIPPYKCVCKTLHFHCHVVACKCELHRWYINV